MDKNARRLSQSEIEKDLYTYRAIQGITGYAPVDSSCSIAHITQVHDEYEEKRRIETQKEGEFKAARDNAVKAEHDLHDTVLKVKDQVRAQFGADSNEYQSLGMKKKSEYRTRAKTPPAQ